MAVITTTISGDECYREAKAESRRLRSVCQAYINDISVNTVDATKLISILNTLVGANQRLERVQTVSDFDQAAQSAEQDPGYQAQAEYLQLTILSQDAVNVIQGINTDSLIVDWTATGLEYAQFSPAQSSALIVALQDIVDWMI